MKLGKVSLFGTVAIILLLVVLARGSGAQDAQPVQPGWDGIRIAGSGTGLSYEVYTSWAPVIVPTPDGGAWAFFSVRVAPPAAAATPPPDSPWKLYASRFDPQLQVWLAAQPLPGSPIQFGPTAVVSPDGTVHLVFSDRARDAADSFGTLVYTRSDGDGGWSTPTPIAPDPNAGHQLAPSVALDQDGELHVVWQDQRSFDAASRQTSAVYTDIFASSLTGDTWSRPVQLDVRPNTTTYYSRAQLVADGDRLVVAWSVYDQAADTSALRLEWTTRPLTDPAAWEPAQSFLDRESNQVFIGGRLLDMAADPTGGVTLIYAKRTETPSTPTVTATYDLYLRRLPAGSTTWTPDMTLASGDRGSFPSLAIAEDGTTYVAYNQGFGDNLNVAVVVIPPGADQPGPELVLTPGENGRQGNPAIAVDDDGGIWVLYLSERISGVVDEIRVLRRAIIPTA